MKIFVNCVLMLALAITFCPRILAQAAPDCDAGLAACHSYCDTRRISNSGGPLLIQPADFKQKCESSCTEGFRSCKVQDSRYGYMAFGYHCASACPWTVTIKEPFAGMSVSLDNTDSFFQCRQSCIEGQAKSFAASKQMAPRKRPGKIDACMEAQANCYARCSYGLNQEMDQCAEACYRGVAPCQADPAAGKCKKFHEECVSYCPPYSEKNDIEEEPELEPAGVSYCQDACAYGERTCQEILK